MVHGPLRRVSRLRVSASPEVSCLASCVSRVSASGEAPEGLQECIPSGSSFVVRRLLFGGPDRERERECVFGSRVVFLGMSTLNHGVWRLSLTCSLPGSSK